MAEETKQDIESGEVAETTDTTIITEDTRDYKAELEAKEQAYEKLKLDNAGLDRKISEKDKAEKERLIATETADQKKKREAEEKEIAYQSREDDISTREAKAIQRERTFEIKEKARELNFTTEQIEALNFPSVEAVVNYRNVMDDALKENNEQRDKEWDTKFSGSREQYNSTTKTDELSPLEKKIISRR